MNSARGYCRVSTAMQANDGASLETQKQRIEEHCKYRKLQIVDFYVDEGISGKNMERPALKRLLQEMQPGECVIVSDLSRLSRDTRDALGMFEDFTKKGVKFVCLSPEIDFSTPVGQLIFSILMAVHKLERERIAENVSMNMQRLSNEGKLRAKPPFGYRFVGKDKDHEPVEQQIKVRDKIVQLYQGGMKITHIAQRLNSDKDNLVLSLNKADVNRECKFHPSTVKRILVDLGLIKGEGSYADRKPVEQRIVSYHKTEQ